LVGARATLDAPLDPKREAAVSELAAIDDLERLAASQVARASTPIRAMLGETTLDIGRDAGVQRAVTGADDVDVPSRRQESLVHDCASLSLPFATWEHGDPSG